VLPTACIGELYTHGLHAVGDQGTRGLRFRIGHQGETNSESSRGNQPDGAVVGGFENSAFSAAYTFQGRR